MKKFEVTVITEKTFTVEIDDTVATEEELTDWESVFWDLDSEDTKLASYVSSYCELRATKGNTFIEGFGIVAHKDLFNTVKELKGDNVCDYMKMIKADDDGYSEVYLKEIKMED